MKNLISASVSLLAAAALPISAMAQDDVDTATEKKIVMYGLLGGYTYLTRSTESSPVNHESVYARLGAKVSEGVAKGRLEFDATGDKVGLRHANVGLGLDSGTTFTIGRYRPGGADGWGADATIVPDQYSSMDGLHVTQDLEFGEDIKLTGGLGLANAQLSLAAGLASDGGEALTGEASNRPFRKTSFKADRAVLLHLGADVMGASFKVYHSMEANQLVREETEATVALGENDTVTVTPATERLVADASHTEVSLGYDFDGLEAGAWYATYDQAGAKNITSNKGGVLETGDAAKATFKTQRIGLGVQGDSSLFGLTGLLQPEDMLIYSASFVDWSIAVDGSDVSAEGKKTLEDQSFQQVVVGGGYKAGGLSLELNVAQRMAKDKVYANADGEAGKEDSKLDVYLASIYVF